MSTSIVSNLSPTHWRVLTHLRLGFPDNARKVVDGQQASLDVLVTLQNAGLIEASCGAIEVQLIDVTAGGLGSIAIALTSAGRRKIQNDPRIRVISALIQGSNAAAVQYLRKYADADDATLRAMADARLVTADTADGTPPIPLATFRKIPNRLYIRLTKKGRRYWAFPTTEWFPGLDVAAEYGNKD